VDKARFPRDKLCGGLFSGRSRKYFAEAFKTDIDPSLFSSFTDVEFWARGEHLATRTDVPPIYLTMRRDLDKAILGLALRAGALNLTGQAAVGVAENTKELVLKDGTSLRYEVLIGADGVNSSIARALFGQAFDPRTVGLALEIEHQGPTDYGAAPIRIDFGAATWGYGWSFQKKHGRTIGVGGLHRFNPNLREKFAAYLEVLGLPGTTGKVRGCFIPFGTPVPQPGRGSVLLCGDAAGLVDPLTGEGIAYAIKSGQIAAECAASALAAGKPGTAIAMYRTKVAGIRRSISQARAIRAMVYSMGLSRAFQALMAAPGSSRSSYMDLLAGDLEYPGLLRRKLTELPRRALSIGWKAATSRGGT
jgi:flavin-dependent dehydrogenase